MNEKKVILHVEDRGDHRKDFIRDVIKSHEQLEVVHPCPPEQVIPIDEVMEKIENSKREFDFIVVDLAMSERQHAILDRFFDDDSLPSEPPDVVLDGGIGLIHRLIKERNFNPDKLAIWTAHLPTGGAFRDLNQISDFWWDANIQTYYKGASDDSRELRRLIYSECDVPVIEEPEPVEAPKRSHVGVRSVFCVSDKDDFRKKLRGAIESYNKVIEEEPLDPVEFDSFKTLEDATNAFDDIVKGRKQAEGRLYIIDITANQKEDDAVKRALGSDSPLDELDQVLFFLDGVKFMNYVTLRDKYAAFIVVTDCGYHPSLVRWFKDKEKFRNVKFVIDMNDFKMNFVTALWFLVADIKND